MNAHRFYWLRDELQREGTISKEHAKDWQDSDFEMLEKACRLDTSMFNRPLGDGWIIIKERNWGSRGWIEGRMNRFWIMPADSNTDETGIPVKLAQARIQYSRCFVCGKGRDVVPSISSVLVAFERYELRTPICDDCLKDTTEQELRAKVHEMYNDGKNAVDTTGLPKPAEDFWNRNNSTKKLDKEYDGKPITFEIDTDNPNQVTLTYPNGQTATVHDKVMYESVRRA